MTDNRTTELKTLSKLKKAGKLHYWRGTLEINEYELHAICDEIQAEHEQAIAATLGSGTCELDEHGCCTRCEIEFDPRYAFCPYCGGKLKGGAE